MKLLLTCEHGGNIILKPYATYFKNARKELNSHFGFDFGALDLFKTLMPLADYSKFSEISRLLIELNRSLHHPKLFSNFSKELSKKEKETLINTYYLDYRNTIESTINQWIDKEETVVHLSIHTFTPILNNIKRNCDIGLLYDSRNIIEATFCTALKKQLKISESSFIVRHNYPYLGKADGFTTYLRKQFKNNYLGIELEVNQKFVKDNKMDKKIADYLYSTIEKITALQHY